MSLRVKLIDAKCGYRHVNKEMTYDNILDQLYEIE